MWQLASDADCDAAQHDAHLGAEGLTVLSSFIRLRACTSTVAKLLKVGRLSNHAACVVRPPNTTAPYQNVVARAVHDVAARAIRT